MPTVRRFHNRGANVTVEAHAEVLFTPAGVVGRWTNRLSNSITRYARDAAPTNKRPRWAHYGTPLKETIHSATDYDPATLRVNSVIGATSPHAYYVDQGTGVYNGSGPYPAKVLPPSAWRAPDVYVQGMMVGRTQAPQVWIRGQKGQKFLDAGVRRGFAQAHLLSHDVPTASSAMNDALDSFPEGLVGHLGNTPSDGIFKASLAQWKEWRREYWVAREMNVRHDRRTERKRVRAEKTKAKAKKPRLTKQQQAEQGAKGEMRRFLMNHPGMKIVKWGPQGYWVQRRDGKGGIRRHDWSGRVADLFHAVS